MRLFKILSIALALTLPIISFPTFAYAQLSIEKIFVVKYALKQKLAGKIKINSYVYDWTLNAQ